jgi:hypothetical protein
MPTAAKKKPAKKKPAFARDDLHFAADQLDLKEVKRLLKAGAPVNGRAFADSTPLEMALGFCTTNAQIDDLAAVVRVLFAAGARSSRDARDYMREIAERFEQFHDSTSRPPRTAATVAELCKLVGIKPPEPRKSHDGTSTIVVKGRSWQKRHEELWNLLVPSRGPATTRQGEAIRISGRVAYEILDNGGINWDADYKKMARSLVDILGTGKPLAAKPLAEVARIVDGLVKNRRGDCERLSELAVTWVMQNREPVPRGKVTYKR